MRRFFAFAVLCGALSLNACAGAGRGPSTDPTLSQQNAARMDAQHRQLEIERAQAAMVLAPHEPYWPYRVAELQLGSNQAAAARAQLDHALTLDADFAPAISLISKLDYQEGRHEFAIALLEGALSRQPEAPDALRVALALHLEALGEFDRAAATLRTCTHDGAARSAAETFVSLRGEGFLDSMGIAEAALRANPDSPANHNNYGIALLYAGRPGEAKAAFAEALARDGELPGALYNMAIVETFYFFDEDAGRKWFERYTQHSTEDPDDLASVLGADLAAVGAAIPIGEEK